MSYPNCEKLAEQSTEHRAIMDFLGEMGDEYCLTKWDGNVSRSRPMSSGEISDLIMKYLGVDPIKLEEERRVMLEEQRKLNEGS